MNNLIIAGLDTETTGLLAADHRIIEVYISLNRNGKKIWEYDQRIDPQRSISADAQRVHKIATSDLIGKPTWDAVGPVVAQIMSKADIIVAHNGDGFDKPFIKQELDRIGVSMPEKPWLDTMLDGVWATPDGKKPRLEELCFACGIPYDPALAHAASYDVERMMDCFHRGYEWGFYQLPASDGKLLAA